MKYDACETPTQDHIERFWRLLSEEKNVRILIDMHRPESFGGAGHWDSSTFSNDIAKALVAERDHMRAALTELDDALKRNGFREGSPIRMIVSEALGGTHAD